jgi:hypothetical protein
MLFTWPELIKNNIQYWPILMGSFPFEFETSSDKPPTSSIYAKNENTCSFNKSYER